MRAERTWWRAITRFGTMFVVGVLVLVFLTLGFGREYLRNREIERNISDLEAQNEQLEGQQLAALSVIQSLSSEYYLESEAREKRGLAKPGEELVVIQADDVTTTAANDDLDDAARLGNVTRWYYYFFDRSTFTTLTSL